MSELAVNKSLQIAIMIKVLYANLIIAIPYMIISAFILKIASTKFSYRRHKNL